MKADLKTRSRVLNPKLPLNSHQNNLVLGLVRPKTGKKWDPMPPYLALRVKGWIEVPCDV